MDFGIKNYISSYECITKLRSMYIGMYILDR